MGNDIAIAKAKFRESMLFIYPDGIATDKKQWRDVCKIYLMGALDALIAAKSPKVAVYLAIAKQIGDYNWWPDESFKWW